MKKKDLILAVLLIILYSLVVYTIYQCSRPEQLYEYEEPHRDSALLPIAIEIENGSIPFRIENLGEQEMTFYSSSSDGYIYRVDPNYTACRDATSGGYVKDDYIAMEIGQEKSYEFGIFWIFRGFVFFDTSSIPDDLTITSATLSFYGYLDLSTEDFYITVQNGQPTYPHDPLVLGDYDRAHYSGNGGQFHTSTFSVSGYNNITLNSNGISWINKTGVTKFCLRSDRDIDGIEPTTCEFVWVYTNEKGSGYQKQQISARLIIEGEQPVGGIWVSPNKFELLVPYIGLTSTIIVAIAVTAVFFKYRKKQ